MNPAQHPQKTPTAATNGCMQPGSGSAAPRRKPFTARRARDLRNAVMLRPREVFELYGIPPSTVSDLCRHPDPDRRLPSSLIPGRGGRKGMRLIPHSTLVQWLAKWAYKGT